MYCQMCLDILSDVPRYIVSCAFPYAFHERVCLCVCSIQCLPRVCLSLCLLSPIPSKHSEKVSLELPLMTICWCCIYCSSLHGVLRGFGFQFVWIPVCLNLRISHPNFELLHNLSGRVLVNFTYMSVQS